MSRTTFKVMLDPGHGGRDSGAKNTWISGNLYEKDVNLAVGKLAFTLLSDKLFVRSFFGDNSVEIIPYLTRDDDRFVKLCDRVLHANTLHCDFFVSIHCNAHTDKKVGGMEVHFFGKYNPPSETFAETVLSHISVEFASLRNRGVKNSNFQVLREQTYPTKACLVELAFISNDREALVLQAPGNQFIFAEAIAKGILAFIRDHTEKP